MSNSDPNLTPAEEALTRYLDGQLGREEAAALERVHPEVVQQKAEADRLRAELRKHSPGPVLRNGEFFNHQILREIEFQRGAAPKQTAPAPVSRSVFWGWTLAAAACLAVVFVLYREQVPPKSDSPQQFAQVMSVDAGESLKVRVIPEEGMAVVMIDGLEPIVEDFILD